MINSNSTLPFIVAAIVAFVVSGCTEQTPPPAQIVQVQPQAVCPKGLPLSICNNSSALHGQIMIHNKTDKSYNVKVYTHGMESPDVQHIMPGSGWSFTGVLQGQRMVIATPMAGGESLEEHCMVTGGMQHTMDITHYGLKQVDGHDSHRGG